MKKGALLDQKRNTMFLWCVLVGRNHFSVFYCMQYLTLNTTFCNEKIFEVFLVL